MKRTFFPLASSAVCLDCLITFDFSEAPSCPTCGAEIGIASVRITGKNIEHAPAAEEKEVRA